MGWSRWSQAVKDRKYFNISQWFNLPHLTGCFTPGSNYSHKKQKESGNMSRLNRNFYVILKFTKWPKTPGITLKSDSQLPKNFFIICVPENLLKMLKNAFYFILKTLFILKIFKFLSWLFGHTEKTVWLERQGFTFQISWCHNLVNKQLQYIYFPISHELKAMKFGQLIEHNKRNIFLQKSCGIWDRETSSRPLFVF